jgi:hypothetical protein
VRCLRFVGMALTPSGASRSLTERLEVQVQRPERLQRAAARVALDSGRRMLLQLVPTIPHDSPVSVQKRPRAFRPIETPQRLFEQQQPRRIRDVVLVQQPPPPALGGSRQALRRVGLFQRTNSISFTERPGRVRIARSCRDESPRQGPRCSERPASEEAFTFDSPQAL